ncbi:MULTISPECIES: hypothetical protein [unclassified Streptomyces]|uniref:hypothetical protein n=1 Tax=unclassified Streptomyces TaxID=2593676 RepID=UPI000851B25F|nr:MULTISPECIES: hypothetical protein [unclassified Streptomyces]MDQ0697689.1 hypothetical protein [Streptomyces sp. W4I9-2]MDX3489357.1 hypothetical protein [Streptomyces sp. ID05-18]
MSSSDQQYPYPYDPERQQQQPAAPHWPDGTAGQSAVPQEPAAFDQGATQTWQAPTWDTQYQPTIRPDGEPHRAQAQAQGYGQPQQPDPYGQHQQQPAPYGTPEPHPPYQPQYQEPQHQPQYQEPQPQQHYQEPQQPYRSPAADTAYLPPQGASGSFPLPPEVPAAPVAPATPVSASEPVTARPEAGDTGYSAPTTLGNARITDAQRARAEGRSPIIAPGMQPAALTAVLGLLLAGGAAIGPYALLVPVVLLQAVTAAGWFRLNGMWPARQGIALAFAGGLVADVALLAAGREHGPAALLGTLGVWVLLTVVLQLRSHAGADERMYGLMATVVSASLAVLAGGHLAAVPDAVVVGGVAVAAATLVRALPLPGAASVAVALLAGVGAGLVAGNATDIGAKGALLGLAAAGCALIGLRVASYDYPSRFVHMTAGVALPLAAAAPAVYLVGRAIV